MNKAIRSKFQKVLDSSRFFEIQYSKLLDNNIDPSLLDIIINYFISYANYYNLSDNEITEAHIEFLNEYKLHLKEFGKTNKYPFQNNVNSSKERLAYDIPLLCSSFLSYHRYCIFETLNNTIRTEPHQSVLVVGVGPGIELAILNNKSKKISAYDTDVSKFTLKAFPEVSFHEKYFTFEPTKLYDKIVLIEILEHLENPFNLLTDAMKSLKPNGRIHFTTAVNIPQFDHLYNFKLEDEAIDTCIRANNYETEYKLDIPHNYQNNVKAYNCYYVLKKTNDF